MLSVRAILDRAPSFRRLRCIARGQHLQVSALRVPDFALLAARRQVQASPGRASRGQHARTAPHLRRRRRQLAVNESAAALLPAGPRTWRRAFFPYGTGVGTGDAWRHSAAGSPRQPPPLAVVVPSFLIRFLSVLCVLNGWGKAACIHACAHDVHGTANAVENTRIKITLETSAK